MLCDWLSGTEQGALRRTEQMESSMDVCFLCKRRQHPCLGRSCEALHHKWWRLWVSVTHWWISQGSS